MNSVVVNAHVICKRKLNARMSLLHFKVILVESLTNKFSSRKGKFTSEEPKLALELPQALKEPAHIAQFIEKCRRCMYCLHYENKDTKCFTNWKS